MTRSAFSDNTPNDDSAVPRKRSTTLVIILAFGAFAILLVWSLRPAQPAPQLEPAEPHPSVGLAMGSFQLTPLVGDTAPVTLESLRGEVVLINFWGTWCGPCLIEFPHLVELNDRLKGDKRFRFIPVSCGPGGSEVPTEQLRAETAAYLGRLNANLDVYSDPGSAATLSLVNAARLDRFGYPTTVLLDQDGTIQGLWQGYAPGVEAEMEEAIKVLLKS
ncbi:MAG: TlpA family protein disulfide reductase [Planctomycetota bacterium]